MTLARLLVLFVAGASAACGGDSAPHWVALARGFRPAPLLPLAQRWQSEAGLDPARSREILAGIEVTTPLAPAGWTRAGADTWKRALPGGAFAQGAPGFLRLAREQVKLTPAPEGELAPGAFRLEGNELVLRLAAGQEPPELVLEQRLEQGRASAEGVWQLRYGQELANGIPVWQGETSALTFDLPGASVLRCELRFLSRAPARELTFTLRLDGKTLLVERADSGELASRARTLTCELPARARAGARLELSFEGPPGCLLVLNPLVGPRAFGSYGARPWPETRPDIVLFLADTFRADNLALQGGDPGWTPNLNRFAERALACTQARSNAAWTLPSVASLLSGFAPGQHTANAKEQLLPDQLVTLAERLARAGYRTGAVTDAAFVSPNYGLDQGFESFHPNNSEHWDLDWTLARAREFLAQDDGRPVFLLVHTYRAHMPYRVGPEEDQREYAALQELYHLHEQQERYRKQRAPGVSAPWPAEWHALLREVGPRYAALYRAGARDVDRGFGELESELERRGLLPGGVLLFTSDHGEALGENDDFFHDHELWESKLRVPLLLAGPGCAPGRQEHVVTLLDVAPTLARLAGLAPDPDWLGQDLTTVDGERPALAFRLNAETQLALVEGGRKLLARDLDALEQGRFEAAYELTSDPREERALDTAEWAAELARHNARLVRRARGGLVDPVDALIQPDLEKTLKHLGYGGDD